ncbi:hypothetical protein LTR95_001026 [Oleoguttula sp. CCFEE 5521]
MALSPYTKVVQPPIRDFTFIVDDLKQYRVQYNRGDADEEAGLMVLEIAEQLLEHCDFLKVKLDMKRRKITELEASLQSSNKGLQDAVAQVKASIPGGLPVEGNGAAFSAQEDKNKRSFAEGDSKSLKIAESGVDLPKKTSEIDVHVRKRRREDV